MLKKGLFIVAVVAMLAMTAQAGEIKLHSWPCAFVPQEITTIPVYLKLGYYIWIKDQTKLKIDLAQVSGSVTNYEGSVTMTVKTNFNVTFSTTITSTGAIGASSWQSWTTPTSLLASTAEQSVVVTARANGVNMIGIPANVNTQVATVKVLVVPTV